MGKTIELSKNIEECVEIINEFVNSKDTPDDETVINAMKYLKLTTENALKGEHEPEGCPRPQRFDKVK